MWTSAVCCLLLWQNEPHFVLMCIFWSVFQFHRASDKHPDLPAFSLVFTEEPVSFCDARNHVHVPVRAGWVLQEFHARPLVRFLKPGTCWTIPLVLPPLPLFTFLLLYSPASVLHYICSFPFLLDISLMSSSSSLSLCRRRPSSLCTEPSPSLSSPDQNHFIFYFSHPSAFPASVSLSIPGE